MAVPSILALNPASGDPGGGDLVVITGTDFAEAVEVDFGANPVEVVHTRTHGGTTVVVVVSPAGDPGDVDVTIRNLDGAGAPVPTEEDTLADGFAYERRNLVQPSALLRLVRQIILELRRSVLEETGLAVSVDYDYNPDDPTFAIYVDGAKAPSITISGPEFEANRILANYDPIEVTEAGPSGDEVRLVVHPEYYDLVFECLVCTVNQQQLMNLQAALIRHYRNHPYIELSKDPLDATQGVVTYEIYLEGPSRKQAGGGKDDLRLSLWTLRVEGVIVTEADLATDLTAQILELVVEESATVD